MHSTGNASQLYLTQIGSIFLNHIVLTVLKALISNNNFIQMDTIKNEIQNHNGISDIIVKLQQILALAKEIEQLSRSEEN